MKEFVVPVRSIIQLQHTVDEAMNKLREQNHIDDKVNYFYVVDKDCRLAGVVSARNLLLNPPHTPIKQIIGNTLISISSSQTLQEAMELLSKHHLLAVPVVDEEEKLLGVIEVQIFLEDALDLAQSKMRTDLFQMVGLTLEEGKTAVSGFISRMPWIFCNIASGIACAIISRVFEIVLAKVLLLAFFIPLVLTLSESISMQSMTKSIQLLHRHQISWKRLLLRIYLEWRTVILLATTSGILVGAISLFWGDGVHPALVIGIGISTSVTVSAIIGAFIPVILHAKKLDPKVAAGPVVLMFVDVITTAIYLALATWWLL